MAPFSVGGTGAVALVPIPTYRTATTDLRALTPWLSYTATNDLLIYLFLITGKQS